MSSLPAFDYLAPSDIDVALAEIGESHIPYAGGTELILAMRLGLIRPRALVNLKGVQSLKELAQTDSGLEIGAAATHQQVIKFLEGRNEYGPLRAMLARVGNPRVRSAGTVGGNLCFAEPRSDIATLLAALGAQVELISAARGTRLIHLTSFIQGAYVTDRRPDEIMTRVLLPRMDGARYTYLKFQTGVRPTAGVALVELPDLSTRVAIGAVCETPAVHDLGTLSDVEPEAIAESVQATSDIFGSKRFKRHIVSVLIRRAITGLGRPDG